jgi:outer membrane immunogenic protein
MWQSMFRWFFTVAAVSLVFGPAAFAGEGRTPTRHWNGCYVGGFAGAALGNDVRATEPVSQGGTFPVGDPYGDFANPFGYHMQLSAIGGGTVGCNYQAAGSPFVLGVEGELGALRMKGSILDPNGPPDTATSTKSGDWYGVVAGRLGVLSGNTLVYGKAGVAFLDTESTVLDTCTVAPCGPATLNATGSARSASLALGGGIEYALSGHWSLKGEYLFIDRDGYDVCGAGGGAGAGSNYCATHDLDGVHTVKFGINYKFGQ